MELLFSSPDNESTPEATLDREAILDKLFEIAEELGLDVEVVDVEYLLGQDDNDFLGNLATLALEHGIDHEEFFERLGIPLEHIVESN